MRLRLRLLAIAAVVARLLPAADPARLFVYARRETPASSWLTVTCDGSTAAAVKRGFFFALTLPPGRHSLSSIDGVPVSVDLAPGGESYIRLDWQHQLGRPPIPVLKAIQPAEAEKEMRFLTYIQPKRIYSSAVTRVDPRSAASPKLKRRPVP